MKLKHLAAALEEVPAFPSPKYEWEQYKTGADLAAQVIFAIQNAFGDIEGKRIVDLGCGTGILGIGAALMGAEHVLGLDCDPDAINTARITAEEFEVTIDFVRCAISGSEPLPVRDGQRDVAIMNPPFGTRKAGADVDFLVAALKLVHEDGIVYSLHKSSTRAHLVRLAETMKVGCQLVAQLRFDIPATYAFHTEDSLDVDVDLLRFVKGSAAPAMQAAHPSIPAYVPVSAAAVARGGGGRGRGRGGPTNRAPAGRGGAAAGDVGGRRGRSRH